MAGLLKCAIAKLNCKTLLIVRFSFRSLESQLQSKTDFLSVVHHRKELRAAVSMHLARVDLLHKTQFTPSPSLEAATDVWH